MAMKIDVAAVMRQRIPGVFRMMPRPVVKWVENTICQDRLNELLELGDGLEGADFADSLLRNLSITYAISGGPVDPTHRRVIFASNHPLGGLDGIVLCSMIRRLYGSGEMKFIVNDLLTYVEPLRNVFLGVNKHGAQSRGAAEAIDKAFDGDMPMVMFPAGLCSRMGDDGTIRDLAWHKMIVNKAISSHRDIIPVHFSGENSPNFYKFARLRKKLGLKFNLEMVRLPREMILNEGARFEVTIGEPIPWQQLRGGREALDQADKLRTAVYALRPQKA